MEEKNSGSECWSILPKATQESTPGWRKTSSESLLGECWSLCLFYSHPAPFITEMREVPYFKLETCRARTHGSLIWGEGLLFLALWMSPCLHPKTKDTGNTITGNPWKFSAGGRLKEEDHNWASLSQRVWILLLHLSFLSLQVSRGLGSGGCVYRNLQTFLFSLIIDTVKYSRDKWLPGKPQWLEWIKEPNLPCDVAVRNAISSIACGYLNQKSPRKSRFQ